MAKQLKKNSFIEGTILSYFAIIVTKLLGMVYTIPFKGIIGTEGGDIYSIAYNIYSLFLNISTSGIPTALSIIISEYIALGMIRTKEKAYRISQKIVFAISFASFLILFVFAAPIGRFFLSSEESSVSLPDLALAIRVVALCLLIVPFLSVRRGYLQGHKFVTASSFSQVIEQFVRIFVVLVGSYIIINVLHLGVSLGVACALFGAFLGALVTFLYLERIIRANRTVLRDMSSFETEDASAIDGNKTDAPITDDVATSVLIKNLVKHSLAIVVVSISANIYELSDMKLVLVGLTSIGYSGTDTQYIASLIATWGPKICMIITSLAVSMCYSIIPHIADNYVKKDYAGVNRQFNQAINTVLLITVPMGVAMMILSREMFTFFYPAEADIAYGPQILPYLAVVYVINAVFMIATMALQTISRTKLVCISSIVGFLINAGLDIPMIFLLNRIGFMPHVGTAIASIIGESFSILVIFIWMRKDLNFRYGSVLRICVKLILPTTAMALLVIALRAVLPATGGYLMNLCYLAVYALLGGGLYGVLTYKNGAMSEVLGDDFIGKITRRFKRK